MPGPQHLDAVLEDAGRALVHVVGLARERLTGGRGRVVLVDVLLGGDHDATLLGLGAHLVRQVGGAEGHDHRGSVRAVLHGGAVRLDEAGEHHLLGAMLNRILHPGRLNALAITVALPCVLLRWGGKGQSQRTARVHAHLLEFNRWPELERAWQVANGRWIISMGKRHDTAQWDKAGSGVDKKEMIRPQHWGHSFFGRICNRVRQLGCGGHAADERVGVAPKRANGVARHVVEQRSRDRGRGAVAGLRVQ